MVIANLLHHMASALILTVKLDSQESILVRHSIQFG